MTYMATVANDRHSYTRELSAVNRLQAELQATEENSKTRSDLPTISEITELAGGEITATYRVKDQTWAAGGHGENHD